MVAFLNASVLTSDGTYTMHPITLEDVKELLSHGYQSYIGHESTASLLSQLTGFDIPMNRAQYTQVVGDAAIVFNPQSRIPEGKILSAEEIEEIGYEFKLLVRQS